MVNIPGGQAGVTTAATSMAGADQIIGWSFGDHTIDFIGAAAADGANYVEAGAAVADYAAAFAAANVVLNGLGVIYYAAEITGVGVVVFRDNDADGAFENGEDAVLLVGRTLTDIAAASII